MAKVTIRLTNQPSEAVTWVMSIIDWNVSDYQSSGVKGITEAITFEVEQSWFPLRIEIWIEKAERVAIDHIQSFSPTDPDYQERFIPDLGSYYFDVAIREFYEGAPEVALWPLAIIGGLGVLGVVGVGAAVALAAGRKE